MPDTVEDLHWLHLTPPGSGPVPDWLLAVAAFRADVLYDKGRRPEYAGRVDVEARDPWSHHVVVVDEGMNLLGCWRLFPLAASVTSLCEDLFGAAALDAVLRQRGMGRARVGEGGGWAVAVDARTKRLGGSLWAAGAQLAESLEFQSVIAAMGTREGQADALMASAAGTATGLGPLHVASLDDEVVLGIFCPDRATPGFRIVMDTMGECLRSATPKERRALGVPAGRAR